MGLTLKSAITTAPHSDLIPEIVQQGLENGTNRKLERFRWSNFQIFLTFLLERFWTQFRGLENFFLLCWGKGVVERAEKGKSNSILVCGESKVVFSVSGKCCLQSSLHFLKRHSSGKCLNTNLLSLPLFLSPVRQLMIYFRI